MDSLKTKKKTKKTSPKQDAVAPSSSSSEKWEEDITNNHSRVGISHH
jgi:hypothetical protein